MAIQEVVPTSYYSLVTKPMMRMFHPHRILIMKMLEEAGENGISFPQLRRTLKLNDGTLGSHLKYLEQDDFITFEKVVEGHKVKTVYRLSDKGKKTLDNFIELWSKVLLSSDSKSQ